MNGNTVLDSPLRRLNLGGGSGFNGNSRESQEIQQQNQEDVERIMKYLENALFNLSAYEKERFLSELDVKVSDSLRLFNAYKTAIDAFKIRDSVYSVFGDYIGNAASSFSGNNTSANQSTGSTTPGGAHNQYSNGNSSNANGNGVIGQVNGSTSSGSGSSNNSNNAKDHCAVDANSGSAAPGGVDPFGILSGTSVGGVNGKF